MEQDFEVLWKKIKLNQKEIDKLQYKRDYSGLIDCYYENLSLDNSGDNIWERLPQISYCYVKLNAIEKAKQVMQEYGNESFLADQNEVYRAIMLLGLFFQMGENPYIEEVIKNTLLSWISDPKSAEQTKSIVFDYEDYF